MEIVLLNAIFIIITKCLSMSRELNLFSILQISEKTDVVCGNKNIMHNFLVNDFSVSEN